MEPADELHIIAGPAAAGCLREGLALPPDRVLIHHDLLSCGPLTPLGSLEGWQTARRTYWKSLDREIDGPSLIFIHEDRDVFADRERLRSTSAITLWLGTGLADQLMLLSIVALLRRLDVDTGRLRLVQFSVDRGHEVISPGVLQPSQFKDRPPPKTLDERAIHDATAAWSAVTSPEPDGLLRFLGGKHDSLPFLQRALTSLLYRYPNRDTGLNAWEHQLLRYVREVGPKVSRVVGYTMAHDMSFPDWASDTYLFHRLHRLANAALPRPLLTLSGDTRQLRGATVHLTQHGEAILAGTGQAVEWNGIDDWVGGVHLDSAHGRVWFQAGEALDPAPRR